MEFYCMTKVASEISDEKDEFVCKLYWDRFKKDKFESIIHNAHYDKFQLSEMFKCKTETMEVPEEHMNELHSNLG